MIEINQRNMIEIRMLICPVGDKLVKIARVAAQQLEQEGFGKIITSEDFPGVFPDSCRTLLVESGYEESCNQLIEEKQVKIDHYLVLKDLGLEEDAEVNGENVELIKNGMMAECVVIESQSPKFNCPCGFSG